MRYLHISDENAELTRYRSGDLHVTNVVPRGRFDWIKENIPEQLHIAPQLNTYYYGLNLRREPFKSNAGLRRALSPRHRSRKLAEVVLRVGDCLPTAGGGTHRRRRDFAQPQHHFAELLAVDHQRQRAAQAGIVLERRATEVEAVVVGVELRLDVQLRRDVRLIQSNWPRGTTAVTCRSPAR